MQPSTVYETACFRASSGSTLCALTRRTAPRRRPRSGFYPVSLDMQGMFMFGWVRVATGGT